MSKEYLLKNLNYKPVIHPVTPYMKARQEWDERLGHTSVQAKNWRIAFVFTSFLSVVLAATTLILATQKKVVPFIIAVDEENGEPRIIGKAPEVAYQPKAQEIKFFLTHFVSLVRGVPSDPVIIRENWLKAYMFLQRDAANMLNDLTNRDEDSPLKKIGDKTVTVQPISIVQVAGGPSYQARWKEEVFGKSGAREEDYTMSAVFTIEIHPPEDEQVLTQNPLGIYIKNFQWNKEL